MQSSRLIKWNDLWLLMLNDLFYSVIARTKWIVLPSLTVNISLTAAAATLAAILLVASTPTARTVVKSVRQV
jgi:hypothetical protein